MPRQSSFPSPHEGLSWERLVMKKVITAVVALAAIASLATAADARPFHHRHQVCMMHHHHRVCSWR